MTHRRAVAGVLFVTASACVTAWALAYPSAVLAPALVRALADGAAVVAVGSAAVPALETVRYREQLIRRATAPLVIASAVWLVAELARLGLGAAEAAGVEVSQVGVRTVVEFTLHTSAGRAGLITAASAATVWVLAMAAPRSGSTRMAATCVAGVGIAAHPLTGHLSSSQWGSVAIALHALSAALWCGVLAGLVLTVEHRGQWARVLPRFSQLSLWCVAVLVVAGILGATVVVSAPSELYATGYGRVLSAKLLLTAALTLLAWHNRTGWLPAARSHRSAAVVSRSRAYTELALMAAALAVAATLAVTG